MENLLTEFEENILKDAVYWHVTTNEYSVHRLLNTPMTNNSLYEFFLNNPENRKTLILAYWEKYFGDNSSE